MMYPAFDLFNILLFILGIIVVFWVIKSIAHSSYGPDNDYADEEEEETALDILKKRYAKGELTKREFQEMKKDIIS